MIGDHGVVDEVREDVDDLAPALLHHPRHYGLRAVQRSPQCAELLQVVVPSDTTEVVAGRRIELVVGEGIVYEHIHGTKLFSRCLDHFVDRRFVCHVGAVGDGPTAPSTNRLHDIGGFLRTSEVIDDHRCAFFG